MDRYVIIEKIGEGQYGRVFKARRKNTGRFVAIKMISKVGQTADMVISFRREIEILTKMNHPNIMRLLEITETETDFCLVTELGRGELYCVLKDNETLSEEQLKPIAAQLVSAIVYLHNQKIIHRDLKPENILISFNGNVKICDFGFARSLTCTTLALSSVKGTPLYMAPEIILGQHYTETVDVWSLGIILFELYFGKPPFVASQLFKLSQLIVNTPVIFTGQISDEFQSFLAEMLEKDPAHRITSQELLQHPWIAGQFESIPDDGLYRFKDEEFERALSETFEPPDIDQIKKVRTGDPHSASQLKQFFSLVITDNSLVDEALESAVYLMQKDPSSASFFKSGLSLIKTTLPITFITYLLTIPFGSGIALNEIQKPLISLSTNEASSLRDKLLGLLFNPQFAAKAYTLFSVLCFSNAEFLNCVAFDFAPQVLPILAASVNGHPSMVARAACLSILAQVLKANPNAFVSIQPISLFCDAFKKILSTKPVSDIETLCLFANALVLNNFDKLHVDGIDFEFDLSICCKMPVTDDEKMAYATMLRSPLEVCKYRNENLLPIHKVAVVRSLLKLPPEQTFGHLSMMLDSNDDKFIKYFEAAILSDPKYAKPLAERMDWMKKKLPKSGVLIMEIILHLETIDFDVTEILDQMLHSEAVEPGLVIASHLARMSSSYVEILNSVGSLSVAEKSLHNSSLLLRIRAANIIGNLAKREEINISNESVKQILDLIKEKTVESQKVGAFALGNLIFRNASLVPLIMNEIDQIAKLLKAHDLKTVENASGLLGNMVRADESCLPTLVSAGAIAEWTKSLDRVGEKTIFGLSLVCKHYIGRAEIVKNGGREYISKLKKSSNPRVYKVASQMESCL